MKMISKEHNETCCKRVQHSFPGLGKTHTSVCGKPATHVHNNGIHYFCRQHSGTGRFVVRNGDVGEILARFDTEKELRDNIIHYPGMRMQKITKSHRRDII